MTAEKIVQKDELIAILEPRVRAGKRVVFTNGCFDLLHVGHVRYLASARACGDLLVVGLNSDRSVRTIKGPTRPLVPQDQRAEVLAALACVDFVVIFEEPDPGALIEAILPQVLVKGADWPEDRIIGARAVRGAGGTVVRVPVVPGAATSTIIERILQLSKEPATDD
ncbi:MAG: D-glycero-beta-D-manno-heptose 1-phosphate adenylyltransferase [Desulfobacterales bacterium]|nr:D-glycero-beta-D-manno-heptose 1-phosphate adenylyltransferase [Desulfobacterales bacterium]